MPSFPLSRSPEATPLDRDAVQKMIREELQAEKDKKESQEKPKGEDEKKKETPEWFEVGKDLKLECSAEHGFVAESADKAFRFHFGGRFDWDNAWFTQDKNLLIGPSAGTRFQDGTDFRRARFRADGTVWEQIEFAAEVNFATIQDAPNVNDQSTLIGSVGLTEFNLTFREVPFVGNIRAGFFTAPFGLERYTSANVWYYMERSPIFDAYFNPNNAQSGVMVFNSYLDDRLTLTGAYTRVGHATLNDFGFDAEDGRYAGGVRITGLPIYENDGRTLMHLGFDYFHQTLASHTFAVANRMPLRGGAGPDEVPNLLATGNFFSPNGGDVFDFEWALIWGPFSMSAEYALARGTDIFENFDGVNFSGPRGNANTHAYYIEAG
jgi:phosphate-selective porin OprO/OprP